MKHAMILVVMMVAWPSSGRIAHAEEAVVVIGGSATEHDRAIVQAAAEAATRNDDWTVRSKPLTKKETSSLLECHDSPSPWTCVPASLHTSGVYHALVIAVDSKQADNGAPMVVVTGKVIATNTPASSGKQRYCVQCADDRLTATASDLTQELLHDIAVREGHTVIEVRSSPSGAQIVLDGRPVQATNASLNTFPGKHVVVLEKPGFQREIREIIASRGKTAEMEITLQPSVTSDTIHATPGPSRVVPGVILGIGAAAVAAGILLYAIDEAPSPTGGRRYWDTAPAGVAIGVAGLATAGLGAYLRFRAPRSQPTPSVVIMRRGAVIAWTGDF